MPHLDCATLIILRLLFESHPYFARSQPRLDIYTGEKSVAAREIKNKKQLKTSDNFLKQQKKCYFLIFCPQIVMYLFVFL